MNTSLNETSVGNRKFTVLLLKPDYVVDVVGQDTALVHVESTDPVLAQVYAREKACAADHPEEASLDSTNKARDYHVMGVFEGHLQDLKTH